jgi:hypothetical protein
MQRQSPVLSWSLQGRIFSASSKESTQNRRICPHELELSAYRKNLYLHYRGTQSV